MDSKPNPATADTTATTTSAPAVAAPPPPKKAGRHDDAYLRDQAEQRRAGTRFDSARYRRKSESGAAPARDR